MQHLREEEESDTRSRAQFGTDRWTRESSNIANSQLRTRAEEFLATLETTSSTDVSVRQKFGEWEDAIVLLESDPVSDILLLTWVRDANREKQKILESTVPSLAVPELRYSSTPPTAQSTTVRQLRRLLESLDDLKALRTTIVESVRRIAQFDDIKSQIVKEAARLGAGIEGGQVEVSAFEDLFGEELGKYRKAREGMQENFARQEDLLDQIRVSHTLLSLFVLSD